MKTVQITYWCEKTEDFMDEDIRGIAESYNGIDGDSGCGMFNGLLERELEFTFPTGKDAFGFAAELANNAPDDEMFISVDETETNEGG